MTDEDLIAAVAAGDREAFAALYRRRRPDVYRFALHMFVAATAGTLIPLALRALKVDPALASSVFITTLTDVFGFLSWLGLATLFLNRLGSTG